ncbi:deoxyribose-phosphate aldolase [Cotesia glomerata]|uniref:deoxyribose-phosphate aldolase n=1 Tax=Cotesia glomerata TaxID=32391 RepID=A0AAV7J7S8_COTGL|nr:deoxyribose-phosphate aldolase [Cotesia glomerata]KAH0567546.1 hypothetical protein KQX54_010676 [Cotesia glomerata]
MTAQSKILIMLGLNNEKNIDLISINNKVKEISKEVSVMTDEDKLFWLRKALTFIDLTSLNETDTLETIQTLCLKAIKPFDTHDKLHPAAVCIYSERVQDAMDCLENHDARYISVATVSGDFPSGKLPFNVRLHQVVDAAKLEADEIDVVIDRSLVMTHDWDELLKQLSKMREACGNKIMKTILSVGDLPSLNHVYKASMVAMAAGSNFIKTSTGKEAVNATLPVGIVMCEAIKEYKKLTDEKVGIKPAGGIKTAIQALEWIILIKKELGEEWLNKESFRIGASSLLDNIVEAIHELSSKQ